MFILVSGPCTKKKSLVVQPNRNELCMGDDAFKLLKMKNGNFYKLKTKNHKCHYLFE